MQGGTVDLPVIGQVPKVAVAVGGAVVVTIVGVAWWRRQQAGTAVEYAPDLTTGSDTGSDAYRNPAPSYSDGSAASTAPKTDQEWSARVLEKMTWLEPGYLGTILGKYLSGQALTLTEAEVVRSAWAIVGKPPGGQIIILKTDTGQPGGGSGGDEPEPEPDTPASFSVHAGEGVVAAITAQQQAGVDITYDRLVAMNPGMESNIDWGPANRPGYGWDEEMRRQDVFRNAATYKLK
jgi:hypothetical protein